MSWNQDLMVGKSCLSVFQGLRELNIPEPLLCMLEHWVWSGTYKLSTSAFDLIWYLMTILRLYMQGGIKNLHFGQN